MKNIFLKISGVPCPDWSWRKLYQNTNRANIKFCNCSPELQIKLRESIIFPWQEISHIKRTVRCLQSQFRVIYLVRANWYNACGKYMAVTAVIFIPKFFDVQKFCPDPDIDFFYGPLQLLLNKLLAQQIEITY